MNNLLAGTGVGTVFVDHQLCIQRFTPAVTQLINLIRSDIGRPLGHIVNNLQGYDRLVLDVQDVLDTLTPKEVEVQTHAGAWHLLRIRPYRTLENVIEGAVITFMEVTEQKRAQAVLLEHESLRRMAAVMRDAGDAITVQALDGRILAWNQTAVKRYGYTEAEALTHEHSELCSGEPATGRTRGDRTLDSQAEVLEPYQTQRLTKDAKSRGDFSDRDRALERVRRSLRRVHDRARSQGSRQWLRQLVKSELSQQSGTFPAAETEGARNLRQRALEEARARHTPIPEDLSELSVEDARSLLHDLRVHRIELELQNEELRSSQEQLELARARYFDLYDLAPVGYVTIGENGIVLEANLTAAGLLDVSTECDRQAAVVTLRVAGRSRRLFHAPSASSLRAARRAVANCGLVKANGEPFWVRLEARVAEGDDRVRVLSHGAERHHANASARRKRCNPAKRAIARCFKIRLTHC